jgi:hypothetical protein
MKSFRKGSNIDRQLLSAIEVILLHQTLAMNPSLEKE